MQRKPLLKMEMGPVWTCPEIRPLSDAEQKAAEPLYRAITSDPALPASPVATAGLELRVAMMLLQGADTWERSDNELWDRKCRLLFLRPAVEPIAHSYWARLRTLDIDEFTALKAGSAMVGRPLVYRKGSAVGRSLNGDVRFAPLESPGAWIEKIAAAARSPETRSALPAYCFAQTVMTHPFADGNGRFARLMVHAGLAHCCGLGGPAIALAPAFYRRGEALRAALTALSKYGDWSQFNGVFFAVLNDAIVTTRSLHLA
jgi:Fic/DOC family